MSRTDRMIERQESEDNLRNKMDALLDEGSLDGAAKGIATLLKAKGDLDVLSDNQKAVYEQYIAPLLDVKCSDPECGQQVEDFMVADAIRDGRDDALCHSCEHYRNQMQKDD